MSTAKELARLIPSPIKRILVRGLQRKKIRQKNTYENFLNIINQGDVSLNVPDLEGSFWIDVRSHLVRRIFVNGYYEPQVTGVIVQNINGDFIDVGANVGFYSIHVANQKDFSGKVLAMEPNKRAYAYLSRNINDNQLLEMVIPREIAASYETKDLTLSVVDGLEEYSTLSNSLHPGVQGKHAEKVTVKATRIDDLVEELELKPGLIKIDAEGAELDVLKGLSDTLTKFKPTLICEVGGGTFDSDTESIANYFVEADYSVFSLDGTPVDMFTDFVSEIVARPNS